MKKKSYPKIEFRYSWIYDQRYRNSSKIKKYFEKIGKTYPSSIEIQKYIKSVEVLWKKQDKKILKELSSIMKLNWNRENIICYVVGRGRPFSDPLTMRLYKNKYDFIDTLTHEMIHQLQTQNVGKFQLWKQKVLTKKYTKESITTKNHILLHAVHWELFMRIFNKRRLNKQIKLSKRLKTDYLQLWRQ